MTTKGTPYRFLRTKAQELAADAINAMLHANGEAFRVQRGEVVITRRGGRVFVAFVEASTDASTRPAAGADSIA